VSDLDVAIDPFELEGEGIGAESVSATMGEVIDRYGVAAMTDTPAEALSELTENTPVAYQAMVDQMMAQVNEIVGLKWVAPLEVPAFFDWLNVDQGIEAITPQWVDEGQLYNYAYSWGQATGAIPPGIPVAAPATAPVPVAPLPTPTQGQKATAAVASGITPQQVTAPGLSATATAAISQAIGVATADALKAQAALVDKMLPGLAPGQVPQALSQIYSALRILEAQYAKMRQELSGPDPGAVGTTLASIANALASIQGEVTTLTDQLALVDPSALEAQVTTIGDNVAANTSSINTITEQKLPEIGAALAGLTTVTTGLTNQLDTEVVPQLAQTTQMATQSAAELALTDADCLAKLCDSINNVSEPITKGGATPSLLSQLGGLLGKAFALGLAATMVDTVLTILDAKAAVAGVISDTETLTGWAETAANSISTDLSWQGALGT
jgi:hypothetical protein